MISHHAGRVSGSQRIQPVRGLAIRADNRAILRLKTQAQGIRSDLSTLEQAAYQFVLRAPQICGRTVQLRIASTSMVRAFSPRGTDHRREPPLIFVYGQHPSGSDGEDAIRKQIIDGP